jgi:tRNA pseudouridine55 synthase
VLVVDKPEGPTSHDVVALVRRALGQREVGHTGTLDPMATGVLALVLGRATRLAQFLAGGVKRYEAAIRLGVDTDTWDRTGAVIPAPAGEANLPSGDAVRRELAAMRGEQEQRPPPFSAKRVGGTRAYDLARAGRAVVIRPARVALHEVEVVKAAPPLVEVRLSCSAGYYVRALAHDLGQRLGCGGCLERLRRLASGPFDLSRAVPLASVAADPGAASAAVVPVEELFPDLPVAVLTEEGARRASHGNDVGPAECRVFPAAAGGTVRLLEPGGRLLALAGPGRVPGTLHPAVVLK